MIFMLDVQVLEINMLFLDFLEQVVVVRQVL